MIGLIIGFILTLCVYSYVLGDNPLFRLASHLLVGVSAAYAAVVVVQQILWPVFRQVQQQPTAAASLLWLVPLALALLLILQRLPAFSWLGSITLGLLIGVGTAVSLTGALLGTLWPQLWLQPTATAVSPGRGVVIALLTAVTLLSFQFYRRSDEAGAANTPPWLFYVTKAGQTVLLITFGVLFANVLSTGLTLLTAQMSSFFSELLQRLS
jgi:hypothetical protein